MLRRKDRGPDADETEAEFTGKSEAITAKHEMKSRNERACGKLAIKE